MLGLSFTSRNKLYVIDSWPTILNPLLKRKVQLKILFPTRKPSLVALHEYVIVLEPHLYCAFHADLPTIRSMTRLSETFFQ